MTPAGELAGILRGASAKTSHQKYRGTSLRTATPTANLPSGIGGLVKSPGGHDPRKATPGFPFLGPNK
jgi:hypothetical protein